MSDTFSLRFLYVLEDCLHGTEASIVELRPRCRHINSTIGILKDHVVEVGTITPDDSAIRYPVGELDEGVRQRESLSLREFLSSLPLLVESPQYSAPSYCASVVNS